MSKNRTNPLYQYMEQTWRLMDKVVKFSQRPYISLVNSPPFILDLIPDTYQHLRNIARNYEKTYQQILDNDFFCLYLTNLRSKCIKTIKILKLLCRVSDKPESDNYTVLKRSLNKMSLIFSHMLLELKAIFPNGMYIESGYKITKTEAANWWNLTVGNDRVNVSWRRFKSLFSKVHPINSSVEAMALKTTIDLTCNDHISIFEFDVFTRLFQPWSSILKNWNFLAVSHPGYSAFLTYDEQKAHLAKFVNKSGTYAFRLSCTRLGQWAIAYVTSSGQIMQTIAQNKSLCQALLDGQKENIYLYPNGNSHNPDLTPVLENETTINIKVTREQYQTYCAIESTYELCKICAENNKDIKIEPCGHYICSECLDSWMSNPKSPKTCPFCRSNINDTVSVVIDSFHHINTLLKKNSEIGIDSNEMEDTTEMLNLISINNKMPTPSVFKHEKQKLVTSNNSSIKTLEPSKIDSISNLNVMLHEGYKKQDIEIALEITNDNIDMARKILRNFVLM